MSRGDTTERAAPPCGPPMGPGSRHDNHLSALQPGARLNSYTIGAILGIGGFGITYKAREDITNREVAIKEYLPTALAVRDRDGATVRSLSKGTARDFECGLERFRQEAKLLIGLRHPNIVPVLSYFEANGTAYLVMEFQDGTSLAEILRATPMLSEMHVLQFMVPLLDGVEEVHRHDLLHRDIKPENVFIRRNGTPVLLDFGAARKGLVERSKTVTTLLTEGYAPFEQYAGSGNQGPWSDIYALAALMFRCLTGKTPVEAPRRAIAKLRGLPDPLAQDLAELRCRVSPDLAFAVEAALRVVEHERPQSVAALRELIVSPRPATTWVPPGEAAPSSATLIPDMAQWSSSIRFPAPWQMAERSRLRRAARYAIMGAVILAVSSGAYVAGHESWLPEAFHRPGHESAAPAATPAPIEAAADTRRRAEDAPRQVDEARRREEEVQRRSAEAQRVLEEKELKERRSQGLFEYQRQQLERLEAERRVYHPAERRAAEAERPRYHEASPQAPPAPPSPRPPADPEGVGLFQIFKFLVIPRN